MNFFIQSEIILGILTLLVLANVNNETSQELISDNENAEIRHISECHNNIYDVYDDTSVYVRHDLRSLQYCGIHFHLIPNKVVNLQFYSRYYNCESAAFYVNGEQICGHGYVQKQRIVSGIITFMALQDIRNVYMNMTIRYENNPTYTFRKPTVPLRTTPSHKYNGCGYDIYSSTNIIVNYKNNVNCKWTIRNNNYRYAYVRVHYNIESHNVCKYDSLSFYSNNGRVIHKLCDTEKDQNLNFHEFSYTDLREIIFKTDGDFKLRDFQISIKFTNINMMTTIMTTRTTTTRSYKSVSGCDGRTKRFYYDDKIIINKENKANNCKWIAKKRHNHYIVVHIIRLDIEYSKSCDYYSFKVNNDKYCGRINDLKTREYSNDVYLEFHKRDYRSIEIQIQIYYIRKY